MPSYLTPINLNKNELQNPRMQNLASGSEPTSPVKGQFYFNTTDNRAYVYNGTAWIGMDSVGATMTGDSIITALNGSTLIIDLDNLPSELTTAAELSAALSSYSQTTHNHTLDGLSNIAITSNTAGEILKWNGSAWVNNTLAEAGIQAADADLAAIAALAGTSGLLRKTAADTWSLDTNTYATTGQLHSAVTVTDTASINLTLTGQDISAAAIFGTSAGTVAEGNHTHAAYVNQNAFSNIAVSGQNTVAADTATDTLTLVAGSNVTITTNDTTDTITIAATNTTYSNATTSVSGLMSSTDKTKLDGIAAGAEVNVNADWNAVSGDAQILNKPTLGTAAALNTGTTSGTIPVLDGSGKLNASVLPSIAISDTFVVATEAAMLALTAEVGDIAVRTDLSKSFILKTAGASTLANWQELLTPSDIVSSVNGMTGAVTLTYSNVGAAAASHTHAIADVTGLQTALDGKSGTGHTHNYAGSASAGGAANSVANSLILKFDSGTTEGTSQYTFNGSAAKTVDIKGGTNVTLTETAGVVTIASTDTTYTAGGGIGLTGTTLSVAAGTGLTQDADGLSHTDTSTLSGAQGTAGIASITVDGMGHVTGVTTATYMRRYAETLSTSATSYTITHNLNSMDCAVTVREANSPYAQVFCDVEFTTVNTVTVKFATAPTANNYRVIVIG